MIYQNNTNENTQNLFSNTIKELQLGKLLRKSNITKSCGVSAFEVFQFLLLLVFQGKNLFRFLNSKHKDLLWSSIFVTPLANKTQRLCTCLLPLLLGASDVPETNHDELLTSKGVLYPL